ncbi:MAG: SRPBCC domain-containing protein [Acidobacteriia bacterium]|nr:SRPBCC domain-containing protein [Terriglobia bacterium]
MPEAERKHAPIRQSVRVDCPIEDAFRLFTERLAEWWPLAQYSIAGEEAENCVIEPWPGGRVFERSRSGEERDWGSVTAWDPPEHVQFTWNPGAPADRDQTVDVEFCVEADGTRVTLTHSGWDQAGVEVCACSAQSFSSFVAEQMLVAV